MCSNLQACCSISDSLSIARLSVKSRSASRCRRIMLPARSRPRGVSSTISVPSPRRSGHRLQRLVARIHERLVTMRMRRMRRRNHHPHLDHLFNRHAHWQRAVHFHALDFGDLSMLGQHPEFFQNFVQLLLVGHGENFLRRDLAVMQLDAPVGQPGHHRIVRDHHDGASLLVKLAQQPQHDFFIHRVQIPGGLVRQNDSRIIDQRPRNAHPLLLAARQLRRQMMRAIAQARRA